MSKDKIADGDEAFARSSATTFGRSVESHAQIADAESRASPLPGRGETLHLYRLVPTASADDPRWQNSPNQGEVLVVARTSGDARVVAAGRELDFMEIDSAPADDVTTFNASAFRDDKLYTVVEVETDRTDLVRGVLRGSISVDNIKPVEI
ncbi:hypothetical protein J2X72_004742 [Phyllobacterium sp. 1468]|uniref:hypothetical protein n=1 Tax=Phyllobacterium sp. 1468 TaxID=2817759 RepID=UPI002864CD62|nr:hypothetical protein [Phyllobacterium sp. 1468]MDR6635928.1 hypothetical protein [Phyllobacterium sp. 1468]